MAPSSPPKLLNGTPAAPGASSGFDRGDWGACGLLMAAVAAMFWKVLFAGQLFFYRDVLNQSYPEARFVHEVCRRGLLPYWNPYLNFGQPFLANPNSLFFYPTTLLILLLPVKLGYTLHFVLHFELAATGVYVLARHWRQSRLAALFASLVFVLSGPVLSLGSFYNEIAAAAWIPWALFLTDRALANRSARRWIPLTLVFALQFLAGEPFTFVATFLLCFAYALTLKGNFLRPFSRPNRIILIVFVAVGALMIGLSSVQLVPAMGLLKNSLRGNLGLPFAQTTYWSLNPLSLLEMLMPDFLGPAFSAPSLWTPLLNFGNKPYFPSLFIGFIPFFLAFVAWMVRPERRQRFAAWAAIVLLFLCFGRFTPVFSLAYLLVPPLELVRFPIKLLIPFVLLLSILSGWGVDEFRRGGTILAERSKRVLPAVKVFLALVGSTWLLAWVAPATIETATKRLWGSIDQAIGASGYSHLPSQALDSISVYFLAMLRWRLPELIALAFGAALWLLAIRSGSCCVKRILLIAVALALIESVTANYGVNPTVPETFYTYRPPALQHFDPSALPYRFCGIFGASPLASVTLQQNQAILNFDSLPPALNASPLAKSEFQERLLLEHGAMLLKQEGIMNVDVDLSFPVELLQFWVYVLHKEPDLAHATCLLGRSNVRYQVLGQRLDLPTLREVTPVENGSPAPSYLYENLFFLPRAYLVASARYSPGDDETLAVLSSPSFDASRQVLLDERPDTGSPAPIPGSPGRIESFERNPNEVTLRVELTRPGYVVLLDRFDPNWHATIDGREVPILRANLLFRAVQTGPGTHKIRFYYRQRGLHAGLAITLGTLALLAILYLLDLKVPAFDPSAQD